MFYPGVHILKIPPNFINKEQVSKKTSETLRQLFNLHTEAIEAEVLAKKPVDSGFSFFENTEYEQFAAQALSFLQEIQFISSGFRSKTFEFPKHEDKSHFFTLFIPSSGEKKFKFEGYSYLKKEELFCFCSSLDNVGIYIEGRFHTEKSVFKGASIVIFSSEKNTNKFYRFVFEEEKNIYYLTGHLQVIEILNASQTNTQYFYRDSNNQNKLTHSSDLLETNNFIYNSENSQLHIEKSSPQSRFPKKNFTLNNIQTFPILVNSGNSSREVINFTWNNLTVTAFYFQKWKDREPSFLGLNVRKNNRTDLIQKEPSIIPYVEERQLEPPESLLEAYSPGICNSDYVALEFTQQEFSQLSAEILKKISGTIIIEYADKSIYKGNFKAGRPIGQGSLTVYKITSHRENQGITLSGKFRLENNILSGNNLSCIVSNSIQTSRYYAVQSIGCNIISGYLEIKYAKKHTEYNLHHIKSYSAKITPSNTNENETFEFIDNSYVIGRRIENNNNSIITYQYQGRYHFRKEEKNFYIGNFTVYKKGNNSLNIQGFIEEYFPDYGFQTTIEYIFNCKNNSISKEYTGRFKIHANSNITNYEGEHDTQTGLPHGIGCLTLKSGDFFKGYFKKGIPQEGEFTQNKTYKKIILSKISKKFIYIEKGEYHFIIPQNAHFVPSFSTQPTIETREENLKIPVVTIKNIFGFGKKIEDILFEIPLAKNRYEEEKKNLNCILPRYSKNNEDTDEYFSFSELEINPKTGDIIQSPREFWIETTNNDCYSQEKYYIRGTLWNIEVILK